jgi:hypothetical protein
VALYFVIRRARSGSAQYGDLFTLLQVVFGLMSTIILLLALRSISKIIHQHPNLSQSKRMMGLHLGFFLSNLVASIVFEVVRVFYYNSPNYLELVWIAGVLCCVTELGL